MTKGKELIAAERELLLAVAYEVRELLKSKHHVDDADEILRKIGTVKYWSDSSVEAERVAQNEI